jgi:hypothetical protein
MQTVYNVEPARGVVGGIASTAAKTVRARVSDGPVRPGQYVVLDTDKCSHPVAEPTPATRGGVVVRNPYKQNDGVYADGEVVDILVQGDIWVESENTPTVDTPAWVRVVAVPPQEAGAFRAGADGVTAFMIPGLYFRSSTTTPILLEVNKSAHITAGP